MTAHTQNSYWGQYPQSSMGPYNPLYHYSVDAHMANDIELIDWACKEAGCNTALVADWIFNHPRYKEVDDTIFPKMSVQSQPRYMPVEHVADFVYHEKVIDLGDDIGNTSHIFNALRMLVRLPEYYAAGHNSLVEQLGVDGADKMDYLATVRVGYQVKNDD